MNNLSSSLITKNKRALHDYFIIERIEAGLCLQGWEVKSLRAGKVQINDSHVIVKNGAAWLIGATITPLMTASTHFIPESDRTRKLLLHYKELSQLIGQVERKGFTIVPLAMYWKKNLVKLEIALVKGKQTHDKRASIKERDWKRQQSQLLKNKTLHSSK